MLAVPVALSPSLKLGPATKLFGWQKPPTGRSGLPYDVSPLDGRFIVTEREEGDRAGPTQVSVVLNWFSELTRRVADAKN